MARTLLSSLTVSLGLRRRLRLLEAKRRLHRGGRDEEAIRSYQLEQFNRVWQTALTKHAFYRAWRQRHALPERLTALEELRGFPVLRKGDVQEGWPLILRDSSPCGFISTGGSTGQPTRFPRTAADADQLYSNMYLCRSWWGFKPGDFHFFLWGHAHLFGSGRLRGAKRALRSLQDRFVGIDRLNAYTLDEASLRGYATRLARRPGSILIGYASAIRELVGYLESLPDTLQRPRLRLVIMCAETVHPDDRQRIAAQFGAALAVEYGMAETAVLAYTHPEHGMLEFPWDSFLCSTLADGEIVVTNLQQVTFPLVNYGSGDLASADGRNRFPLRRCRHIAGRTNDVVDLPLRRGGRQAVHSELFTHVIKSVPAITHFRIEQARDSLILRLAVRPPITTEAAAAAVVDQLEREFPAVEPAKIRVCELDTVLRTVAGKEVFVRRLEERAASPEEAPDDG